MTIQEFQARKIERIARTVAHFVATTPPDHLEWCPSTCDSSCTRSGLDQVRECVSLNRNFAALLSCDDCDLPESREIMDSVTAQEELIASAQDLAEVVRRLPDEALTRCYYTPHASMTGEIMIDLPCRNMAYHGGQINFIQLLLGDKEFHMHPQAFR
jgi:hypothetical protein